MQDRPDSRVAATSSPQISIVIIGRNEGQRLARCFDSLRAVHDVVIREVIYVDSSSTDGSPQLASQHGAIVVALNAERPTAALGRNAGWNRATGELVLFLDGDTILNSDFPSAACAALAQEPGVAVVWGHRREIHPEASIYNRVLDLDWMYQPGITEFCGGDALMRREALVQTGGFDESLIAGEEPELCRRMRALDFTVLHIDQPMTGHDLQITRWKQYWRRATRAGHAYAEVSARFRKSGDPFWSADRRRNLVRGCFWMISLAIAIAASFRFRVLPLALWLALFCIMSIRSSWKARWKSKRISTLILYGVHSQLQQIPVLVGQLQYELTKRSKHPRKLIEYKERRAD